MSAPPDGKFQDHYHVLGVAPESDTDTIHKAYSHLAAKYRPDNRETGDAARYSAVTFAYEVLSSPAARKSFDELRSGPAKEPPPQFSGQEFFDSIAGERERRQSILCLLYDRRRLWPMKPSLSLRQIETMLTPSSDEIQFSLWYLRQCGYVTSDDKSNLQITVAGMDYLDENLSKTDSILALIKATAPAAQSMKERARAIVIPPKPKST